MNCTDCRPLLGAYIDGELDLMNALTVERHIGSCSECGKEVRQAKAIHLALQNPALAYSAPAALKDRISKATQRQSEQQVRRWWSFNMPSFSLGAACAAVVALLFGVMTFSPARSGSDQIVAAHVRSLMAGHLTDVQSSDSHTVKPWFTGKIDFTAPVNDLAADGFPLLGGRLDYLENRAVMALVYKRNQHTINVFIWPTSQSGQQTTEVGSQRGFSIVRQRFNGLEFDAVSDLKAEELKQFVSLLCR